jgi:hypothetical protein
MSRKYMRAAVIAAVLSISPAFAAKDAEPGKEQPPPEVVSPEPTALGAVDAALRERFKEYVGLSVAKEGSVYLTLSKGANLNAAGSLAQEAWIKTAGKERSKDLPAFEFVTAVATRDELNEAFVKMRDVLSLKDVATLDMNEACGCIQVGVIRDSAFERVASFAGKRGIFKDWIRTVLTPPTFRFLNLRDKYRPTMGGVEIQTPLPNNFVGLCTMGLPTFSFATGTAGFLTASHCTEGDQGKMNGTKFFQGSTAASNRIGVEKLDLDLFTSATNSACPMGRICRFSDAAFVEFTQQDLGITGRLKRPKDRCTASCGLTVVRPTDDLRMAYGISGLFTGDVIDKIGRTTGWTNGAITNTCENVNVSDVDSAGNPVDTGITLLCQIRADLISAGGDSGAPIFVNHATYEAGEFAGILWGGNATTTSFSPINAIDAELGSFVYNQAGMSGTFYSSGLFYTSNIDDQMDVLIQPNAVPANEIEIVLCNVSGISDRKEIVLVEGASIGTGRWTIAVQGAPTLDRNGLYTYQLPGGRLEFRKSINGVMTEVSRLPLDHLPGGTRVTFRWTAD